jgi:hypothetical protein
MPTTQLPNRTAGTESALDSFIFHVDPYRADAVPRNLPLAEVATFIRAHVGPTVDIRPMLQTEKVVDYYDLRQVVDHLGALANRLEGDPSRLRQAVIVARALALVGSSQDVAFAAGLFPRLAGHASRMDEFQELLLFYNGLNGVANPASLHARAETVIASLQQKGDYAALMESQRLDEWRRIALQRAEKAQEVKSQILKIGDRSQRIAAETKLYLALQNGYLEFLQSWAARRLIHETWAAEPASQTAPAANPQLSQEVAHGFQQALEMQTEPVIRVRCLRAIEFFGGTLTREEQAYLSANVGPQVDRLSR